MFFQKGAHLILKRHLSVVLRLIFNVSANRWNIRLADRECAKAGLPGKIPKFRRLCFDPFGRGRLEIAHRSGERHRAVEQKKKMHVVVHRVDEDCRAIHIFENRRHIGVEIGAHRIRDDPFPVFGRENQVNEIFGERLRHDGIWGGEG